MSQASTKEKWIYTLDETRDGNLDSYILGERSAINFISDVLQNSLDQRKDKNKPAKVKIIIEQLKDAEKKKLLKDIGWIGDMENHWDY